MDNTIILKYKIIYSLRLFEIPNILYTDYNQFCRICDNNLAVCDR